MRLGENLGNVGACKRVRLLPVVLLLSCLSGCHSPFINATVENRTGGPISPVEVDYPSASFGIPALGAGATYKYRFKVLGSGKTKVVWTDGAQHEHTFPGPDLHEGQEGSLEIVLGPTGAAWTPALRP